MLRRSVQGLPVISISHVSCPRIYASAYYLQQRYASHRPKRLPEEEEIPSQIAEHTWRASVVLMQKDPAGFIDGTERNTPDSDYVSDWDSDEGSPSDWVPTRSASEQVAYDTYASLLNLGPKKALDFLRNREYETRNKQEEDERKKRMDIKLQKARKPKQKSDIVVPRSPSGSSHNIGYLWRMADYSFRPSSHDFTNERVKVETIALPEFPSLGGILDVKYPPTNIRDFWGLIDAKVLGQEVPSDSSFLSPSRTAPWTLPEYSKGSLPEEFNHYLEACYMREHSRPTDTWDSFTLSQRKKSKAKALQYLPIYLKSYRDILDTVTWDQDVHFPLSPDFASLAFEQTYKGRNAIRVPGGRRQFCRALQLKYGREVASMRGQRRALLLGRAWHTLSASDKLNFCLDIKTDFETWHKKTSDWLERIEKSVLTFGRPKA